jgi:hypothetical protein
MSEVWHLSGSIMSHTAKEILASLITDDKKNYEKIEKEFGDDLSLLDDALVLYITSIQGAYSEMEKWKNQPTFVAPIILFSSVLNILLLIRHSILLGYFPETPTLFRNCHEQITRGYLFWLNESEANRYLAGKERRQEEIDDKLSSLLEPRGTEEKEIYNALRQLYKHQSELSHPNLSSLKLRYGDLATDQLKDKIINMPVWGGMLSNDLIKPVIYSAFQTTLRAISIIKLIFIESSGSYEKEYKNIYSKYEAYIQAIKP